MVTPDEQQEVTRLKESLGGWALGDVKKALDGGAKVGSFLLAAHFIDVLARLSTTQGNAKAAWDEFVPAFMPDYANYSEGLYRGFRGVLSHSYSIDGFRLVDTEAFRPRHLTVERGERVVHLESFIESLDVAWAEFVNRVENDDDFRERVLGRTRQAPLMTLLEDPGAASVAHSPTTAVGTYFGGNLAAQAASGSPGRGWPLTARSPFQVEPPPQPPKMEIPKGKPKRKKK
jgi:hypothetical protein